jgi:hypothetical protein
VSVAVSSGAHPRVHYTGQTRSAGTILLQPTVVLTLPLVGDKPFALPVVSVSLPSTSGAMDLGSFGVTGGGTVPDAPRSDVSTPGTCAGDTTNDGGSSDAKRPGEGSVAESGGHDGGPSNPGDGSVPPPSDSGGTAAPLKRVFVTSNHWRGDLQSAGSGSSGPDGADNLCNAAASAASLGGAWKAFLSTSTAIAISRLVDVGPWTLVDGTPAVPSLATLATSGPVVPIDEYETGAISTDDVWTGTNDDMSAGNECNDWTSSDVIHIGLYGVATTNGGGWTQEGGASALQSTRSTALSSESRGEQEHPGTRRTSPPPLGRKLRADFSADSERKISTDRPRLP